MTKLTPNQARHYRHLLAHNASWLADFSSGGGRAAATSARAWHAAMRVLERLGYAKRIRSARGDLMMGYRLTIAGREAASNGGR